ncbi:START-like domain-containing protein [Neolewinella litorea]|uniref:Activator of HSP90 ATPase 1 family protein n=1 Tax=Neolewinella litorea TaxID=2562452 RepID=A0A4S4NPV6_9BACT|nr:START-like domain-containing protein [Neolewinella litorea]THH41972.1 activator of HSP90 ATPase 1 family protein [Neolewinella litorea]
MERVKFTSEFIFRASPNIVYQFLTDPACLTRWFCDEVDINDSTYTFVWSGSPEAAELIEDSEADMVRFAWEDADDEDEYLEFNITKSPVTGETIVYVTDFADDDEVEDQKALWETQLTRMRAEMGG